MRSLKLDFLHPVPQAPWAAWILLSVGLGLAVWVGWKGQQVQRNLDKALAAAPQKTAAIAQHAAFTTTTGEAATAVRLAKEQLSAPWSDLFVRLETSRPKNIALIALEADARKSEATLTAEACTMKDMLAYIELLKGEAGFASVTLASHALQYDDPEQPVRFVLRLAWRT
jgi:Tfp pilus assembly protein PilN